MLTLLVSLHINAGCEAEFEQFEAEACRIMRLYGGRIERRFRHTGARDESLPDEVHLVTFPDAEFFDRYRSDGELTELAPLRAQAIRETTIWVGTDLSPFG